MILIKKCPIFLCKLSKLTKLILITNLLLACGVSKTNYCNQIILNINEGNSLVDKYKNQVEPADTQKLTKHLTGVTKKLNKIKPKDEKLQEFIIAFEKDFQELSKGFIEISQALQLGNQAHASVAGRKQLEQAKSQVDKAGQNISNLAKRQEKLTTELLAYCQK